MIVVVSNLWPRAQYYERVVEICRKLELYRGDPVIDRYEQLFPLGNFTDISRSSAPQYAGQAEQVDDRSDEFGALSGDGIPLEVVRQYVFFTMVLRAMMKRYANEISTIVAYCSGIIPVLNAMTTEWRESGVAEFSPKLLGQLSQQDAMVSRNVGELDVVMSVVNIKASGLSMAQLERQVAGMSNGRAHITDLKSDSVAVICGPRAQMTAVLDGLRAASPGIETSRMVPHGGLHTPLAAPPACLDRDGDASWAALAHGLKQSPFTMLTSTGQKFSPQAGSAGLERLVRSTFFKRVESGKMTRALQASGERLMFIGLPSVLMDMFIGTGLRPDRRAIVGPEHL